MTTKCRLLAIDDHPLNLQIIAEVFGDEYELLLAEDGISGVEQAIQWQPEIVLLDVMMPLQNGYDVCRRLRSRHELRGCRIIMVSAKGSLRDRLHGFDAGADDYVTKPFDEDELQSRVRFAVRARRLGACGPMGDVLAYTAELRDAGIATSHARVRWLCEAIARRLAAGPHAAAIDQRFVDDLHYACAIHDVGMLALPERVRTLGDDALPQDVELLKQHTLTGSRLLHRMAVANPEMSLFAQASCVARSHHENFNGTGFPDGLVGSQIPLAARIVRIASEIDQELGVEILTNLECRQGLEQVRAMSGVELDPNICSGLSDEFAGQMQALGAPETLVVA